MIRVAYSGPGDHTGTMTDAVRFYQAQSRGADTYGLIARVGDELYAYLPNTEQWHRSVDLETDFYFEHEGTYTEVTPDQVPALMAGVPRIDERGAGGVHVKRRRSQPVEDKRTSAALGIIMDGAREATGKEMAVYLSQSRKGRWIAVKGYRPTSISAARQLKYELRKGKKSLELAGPLESRIVPRSGRLEVQVKRVSSRTSESAQPRSVKG